MGFVAKGNSYVTITRSTAASFSLDSNLYYGDFMGLGTSAGVAHLFLEDVTATTCYLGIGSGVLNTGGAASVVFSNSVISATDIGATLGSGSQLATFGNNKFHFNNSDGTPGSTVATK